MCKRHCTLPFDFVCITENSYGLDPSITIKPLSSLYLQGWWNKPWIFSKELGFTGTVLFLDLDLVIYNNIDKFWTHNPGEFVIIRDFTRHMNPNWKKFNSSVIRFNANDFHWVWENFKTNQKLILSKNFGDQDYLYNILGNVGKYWPDDWIQSYKWEMRDKSELAVLGGKRNFKTVGHPKLTPDCSIAVFHGDPNPDQVKDPWVVENWK